MSRMLRYEFEMGLETDRTMEVSARIVDRGDTERCGRWVFQAYATPKVIMHQALAWFLSTTGLSTSDVLENLVRRLDEQVKLIEDLKKKLEASNAPRK